MQLHAVQRWPTQKQWARTSSRTARHHLDYPPGRGGTPRTIWHVMSLAPVRRVKSFGESSRSSPPVNRGAAFSTSPLHGETAFGLARGDRVVWSPCKGGIKPVLADHPSAAGNFGGTAVGGDLAPSRLSRRRPLREPEYTTLAHAPLEQAHGAQLRGRVVGASSSARRVLSRSVAVSASTFFSNASVCSSRRNRLNELSCRLVRRRTSNAVRWSTWPLRNSAPSWGWQLS